MSSYSWAITKDLIGTDAEKTMGPSSSGIGRKEILEHPDRKCFRMLDDDGTVCYEGVSVADYDGFGPLDDFGSPNAGCTEIQYQEWVTL